MYEDEPESTRRSRNKESIIHQSSHEYRGYIVRQAPFFENYVINIIVNAHIKIHLNIDTLIFEYCFRRFIKI